MDHLRIVMTAPAERDLREIWRYIDRDNPDAATLVALRIVQSFAIVSLFPHIGRRVWRRARYRSYVADKYIVYYEPFQRDGFVRILRIIHAARRRPKRSDLGRTDD
jgi:plasmid stabilization system protein ParE